MHSLQYVSADGKNALFRCVTCQQEIQFNLPGVGEPAAVHLPDDTWATPDLPDQWMSPCTQ